MTKIYAKGSVIINERISRGWTRLELAKRIGVVHSIIQKIEQKKGGVRPATAVAICNALDRAFDELFEIRGI